MGDDILEDGLNIGAAVDFDDEIFGSVIVENRGGLLLVNLETVFDCLGSIVGAVFDLGPFEKSGETIFRRQRKVDNLIDFDTDFVQKIIQI